MHLNIGHPCGAAAIETQTGTATPDAAIRQPPLRHPFSPLSPIVGQPELSAPDLDSVIPVPQRRQAAGDLRVPPAGDVTRGTAHRHRLVGEQPAEAAAGDAQDFPAWGRNSFTVTA